jgi:hypothetical protein
MASSIFEANRWSLLFLRLQSAGGAVTQAD